MLDPLKSELFVSLGYAEDYDVLNRHLVRAGLTTAAKPRISAAKRERVAALLAEAFLRVCRRGDCQARASDARSDRQIVAAATAAACQICGGSALAPARVEMERACARAGWRRLCIVGGSPNARAEIVHTITPPLEVRLVDGTIGRTLNAAKEDAQWADHVVLWGGTQLAHKVSTLYNAASNRSTVARRSVQELYAHIAREANRVAGAPSAGRGERGTA